MNWRPPSLNELTHYTNNGVVSPRLGGLQLLFKNVSHEYANIKIHATLKILRISFWCKVWFHNVFFHTL